MEFVDLLRPEDQYVAAIEWLYYNRWEMSQPQNAIFNINALGVWSFLSEVKFLFCLNNKSAHLQLRSGAVLFIVERWGVHKLWPISPELNTIRNDHNTHTYIYILIVSLKYRSNHLHERRKGRAKRRQRIVFNSELQTRKRNSEAIQRNREINRASQTRLNRVCVCVFFFWITAHVRSIDAAHDESKQNGSFAAGSFVDPVASIKHSLISAATNVKETSCRCVSIHSTQCLSIFSIQKFVCKQHIYIYIDKPLALCIWCKIIYRSEFSWSPFVRQMWLRLAHFGCERFCCWLIIQTINIF